ncbi:MAG: hypothetical protein GY731_09005, partial [Gammaproteobacteria bacterium]|nr:hypothetical protein [Gammaproteobacteria bacterium]
MSAPLPTLALTLSEPPVTGKTEITSSDAQLIEEESGFSELLTDQLSATAKTLIATSAELLPEAAEWMEIPDGGSILPPDTAIAAIPVVDVTLRTTMAAAYGSDKQGVPVEIIPRQAATTV